MLKIQIFPELNKSQQLTPYAKPLHSKVHNDNDKNNINNK